MNDRLPASTPWADTAYGIDDSQGQTVVVRATRQGGRARYTTVSPEAVPATDARSRRTAVAACLLQRESFLRWLSAPLASEHKARRVLPALLDVQLPFSIEDCVYSLIETRRSPDRTATRGLVAGARKSEVEKRLATLGAAGLDPHVLDQEGLALWTQGLVEVPPRRDPGAAANNGCRVLVWQAPDRATLAVGQGTELLGAHSIGTANVAQIVRLLKTYWPAAPSAVEWIWAGPLATDERGVRALHAALTENWPGPLTILKEPAAVLARGLAGRALTTGTYRCNLRMGPFLHAVDQQRQRRAPVVNALTCLAAGLLLCAVNLAWSLACTQRLSDFQRAIAALTLDITGYPSKQPGAEVRVAGQALEERAKQLRPVLSTYEAPLSDAIKAVLTIAQEEGLTIDTVALNRRTLTLTGAAAQWLQCDKAVARLDAAGWRARADRKADTKDGRIAFAITGEGVHAR